MHVCQLRTQTGWYQLYILVLHLPTPLCHDPCRPLPALRPTPPLQLQPTGLSTQCYSPPGLTSTGRTRGPRPLSKPELRTSTSEFSERSQQAAQPSSQRVSSLHAQPVPPSLPHTRDAHTHPVWSPRMECSLLSELEDVKRDWSVDRFLVSYSATPLKDAAKHSESMWFYL